MAPSLRVGVYAVSQLPDVGTRASGEERVLSILRRVGKNDFGTELA